MATMRYKTPQALEMAVTAAARASKMDTGRAAAGFYFHRLLCRIFSRADSPFLLKGGQSMLARTPEARVTQDIDLLAEGGDLPHALGELRELASLDLGDFVTFEFVDAKPIKAEDEYRSGLKVTFVPMLGGKRRRRVSVDLVVDQVPCGSSETVTPADRIEVEGVPVFDYRMYPVANSMADKTCAMFETHNGIPSSRVKDLVDALVYADTCDLDGSELVECVRLESHVRGVVLPERFAVPEAWHEYYANSYRKMVAQTGLPQALGELGAGEEQAAKLLDPVLAGDAEGMVWDHVAHAWTSDWPRSSTTTWDSPARLRGPR